MCSLYPNYKTVYNKYCGIKHTFISIQKRFEKRYSITHTINILKMSQLFIISALMLAFVFSNVSAQEKALSNSDFWEAEPSLKEVKAELKKGFDFSTVQGMQDPLGLAIRYKASPKIISYLLEQPGLDLTHLLHEGRSYLHIAAYSSNAEAANLLLDKGMDMYFLDANTHTPVTFAAYQGKLTINLLDVFIAHGLDVHKRYESKNGANILLLAAPYDKDLIIIDYLISKGVSINSTDDDGNTAFNWAAQIGNVEMMKALLKKGAKFNDQALIMASKGTYRTSNKMEVFVYLVEELKINPKVVDGASGKNVLHSIARKRDQSKIVSYFLDKGVDVNLADEDGNTPFMVAAGGQSYDVVALMFPLVDKAQINTVNTEGNSALQNAVSKGSDKTVSLLLKNGADVQVKDKEGNSLAYFLIQSFRKPRGRGRGTQEEKEAQAKMQLQGFNNKLLALQKAGLDFSAVQNNGMTVYHLAVEKNNLPLLKMLAPLNVDINTQNKEGNTALHKAAMVAQDDEILKYLLAIGAKKGVKTEFEDTAYTLAKENEVLAKKHISVEFLK